MSAAILELYRTIGPTFDAADEAAAEAYGWSIVDKADELLALHRRINEQDPINNAAQSAISWSLFLSHDMILASGSTPAERAGMWLQARWWCAVANEINDREEA